MSPAGTGAPTKKTEKGSEERMSIRGSVVRGWLQAARIPLGVAAAVAVRDGDREAWPPVMVFDGVAAGFLRMAGTVLREPTLCEEGRLEREKVVHLRRAVRLEAEARRLRSGADASLKRTREEDAELRRAVRRRADERKGRLEQQRRKEEERLDEVQAARRRRERNLEKAEQKDVAARRRTAGRTRVRAEGAAVAKERRALATEAREARIEEQIERTKARRRAGS